MIYKYAMPVQQTSNLAGFWPFVPSLDYSAALCSETKHYALAIGYDV